MKERLTAKERRVFALNLVQLLVWARERGIEAEVVAFLRGKEAGDASPTA